MLKCVLLCFGWVEVVLSFLMAVLDRGSIHYQHGTAVKKAGRASTGLVTAVTRGVLSPVFVFFFLSSRSRACLWWVWIFTGVTSPVPILTVVIFVCLSFVFLHSSLHGLLHGRDQLHGESLRAWWFSWHCSLLCFPKMFFKNSFMFYIYPFLSYSNSFIINSYPYTCISHHQFNI